MGSASVRVLVGVALIALTGCRGAVTATPTATDGPPSGSAAPAPATAAPATATTPPAPTRSAAPAFEWRSVGSFPSENGASKLVAASAGYLVLSAADPWFSKDGRTWSPVSLPFDGQPVPSADRMTFANVRDIAAGPEGFIAVGGYERYPCNPNMTGGGPPDCATSPIAWVSANGVDWVSSIAAKLPLQNVVDPDYRTFYDVWAAGDGWDASVESEESVDQRALELLHTADGLHWAALTKPPALKGATSLAERSGVGSASGSRLVWQLWDRITDAWTYTFDVSSDGATWQTVDAYDGRGIFVTAALGADEIGGSWLVGIFADGPVILASTDLVTWHAERLSTAGVPDTGNVLSFARWQDGYLAVVEAEGDDDDVVDQTWMSSDGMHWRLVASMVQPDLGPTLMANGPAGLLAARTEYDKVEVYAAR